MVNVTYPLDHQWSGLVGLQRTLWATCSSNLLFSPMRKFVRLAAGSAGMLCTPCPFRARTRAAVTRCCFPTLFPWDRCPTFWGRGRNRTLVSSLAWKLRRAAPACRDGPAALLRSQDRAGHSHGEGSEWVIAVAASCYGQTFSCSS